MLFRYKIAIKLVESSFGDARQLLIMKAGQLINNKSRFISCMYVLFFNALSQIIFGFRCTHSCQTDYLVQFYS